MEDDEEEEESSPPRPVWLKVAIGLGKGVRLVVVYAVVFAVKAIKAFPLVMAEMEKLYHEIDALIMGRKSGRRRRRPTQREKSALYHQQKGRCKGCGRKLAQIDLEVDHIIPVSAGGSDLYNNKQLLCGRCNKIKGTKTQATSRGPFEERESSRGGCPSRSSTLLPARKRWDLS